MMSEPPYPPQKQVRGTDRHVTTRESVAQPETHVDVEDLSTPPTWRSKTMSPVFSEKNRWPFAWPLLAITCWIVATASALP